MEFSPASTASTACSSLDRQSPTVCTGSLFSSAPAATASVSAPPEQTPCRTHRRVRAPPPHELARGARLYNAALLQHHNTGHRLPASDLGLRRGGYQWRRRLGRREDDRATPDALLDGVSEASLTATHQRLREARGGILVQRVKGAVHHNQQRVKDQRP